MKKFLSAFLAVCICAFGAVGFTACSEEIGQIPEEWGNVLVVYFSAQGHTERVAGYIADATGGDVFELVPVEPYTASDLNWSNSDSRVPDGCLHSLSPPNCVSFYSSNSNPPPYTE